jgi:branched-chain amino acid transport system permease protein
MRGRPNLYVSYSSEMALLPTWTQRVAAIIFLALLVLIPLQSADGGGVIPGLGFLGDSGWMRILSEVLILAIGALGLHILTGLTGQVSLGHAFFMGVGAFTAAVLGGETGKATWGLGLPIWIWLPAAGIVAALVGALVAPTAVRVRGIYLAIVTLGLVFIGEWLWRSLPDITGGSQSGREFPELIVRFWQEEEPLIDFASDGSLWVILRPIDWLIPWISIEEMSGEAKTYLFLLMLTVIAVVVTKNIQRTRPGRSFMAIRDRDVAAEIMGVPEARSKAVSFALSSFYAGVAGALLGAFTVRLIPESFGLFLSVQFLAILLIGGVGTVAGTLMGAVLVGVLPRIVQDFTDTLDRTVESGTGFFAPVADIVMSSGPDDFGLVSTLAGKSPGFNVSQLNIFLYGVILIVFLIFEPLGLFGIWLRIRNYWKGWPFTY